jgi:hypothetical protein
MFYYSPAAIAILLCGLLQGCLSSASPDAGTSTGDDSGGEPSMDDNRDVGQWTEPRYGPTGPTLSDETDTAGDVAELTDGAESNPAPTPECVGVSRPEPGAEDDFQCDSDVDCLNSLAHRCANRLTCYGSSRKACLECLWDAHCPRDRPLCRGRCSSVPIIPCGADEDCADFGLPHCDQRNWRCAVPPDSCGDVDDRGVTAYDQILGVCRYYDEVVAHQTQADR